MLIKKHKPEEITKISREFEVQVSLGMATPQAARQLGIGTQFVEPGSQWENGYIESFNGKPRNELLNLETSDTQLEARVPVEDSRRHYSDLRPQAQAPAAHPVGPAGPGSPLRLARTYQARQRERPTLRKGYSDGALRHRR